jgi:hypothetical protein
MNKWIIPLGVTLASLGFVYIARVINKRRSQNLVKSKVVEEGKTAGQSPAETHDFNAKLKNFLKITAASQDLEFKFKEAASLLRSLSRIPDADKLNLYGTYTITQYICLWTP